jgi:hypothetical protein
MNEKFTRGDSQGFKDCIICSAYGAEELFNKATGRSFGRSALMMTRFFF